MAEARIALAHGGFCSALSCSLSAGCSSASTPFLIPDPSNPTIQMPVHARLIYCIFPSERLPARSLHAGERFLQFGRLRRAARDFLPATAARDAHCAAPSLEAQ